MTGKQRWKAYLFVRTQNVAVITQWQWVEYETRQRAIDMARKNAEDVYLFYKNIGAKYPVEEHLKNGGLLFRIPGISNPDRWPRVEPIEDLKP